MSLRRLFNMIDFLLRELDEKSLIVRTLLLRDASDLQRSTVIY